MKNKFKTLKKNDIKAKIANGIWKFRTKFWNLQWPCGTLIVTMTTLFNATITNDDDTSDISSPGFHNRTKHGVAG